MLFKAKLRCNLDPLKDHDDSVLWEVLKAVCKYIIGPAHKMTIKCYLNTIALLAS